MMEIDGGSSSTVAIGAQATKPILIRSRGQNGVLFPIFPFRFSTISVILGSRIAFLVDAFFFISYAATILKWANATFSIEYDL